jgi:hypothetical protein
MQPTHPGFREVKLLALGHGQELGLGQGVLPPVGCAQVDARIQVGHELAVVLVPNQLGGLARQDTVLAARYQLQFGDV